MRNRFLFVFLTFILCATATLAQVSTIPVAITGEPAPGAPGRTFHGFGMIAIHDSGQLIFGANLDPSDLESDLGLWVGTPGNMRLAVREGDVAPGTGGRLFEAFTTYDPLTRFTPYHPQMNGEGVIVFRGGLKGDSLSEGGGVWAGTPGNLVPVALAGDAAPGTAGRTFRAFNQPFIDERGNILFGANLDDFSQGLWYHGPDGLKVVVARGLPAPGMQGSTFHRAWPRGYSLSPAGQVFFPADVRDTVGNTIPGVWAGDPEDPWLLAAKGEAAPGTGSSFDNVSGVRVRDDGSAVLFASLENDIHDYRLWSGTSGDLSQVPGARRGEPAPGTALPFQFLDLPRMNDADNVVFAADLDPVRSNRITDLGIWTDARGSLELIARQGEPAPGPGEAVFPAGGPSFLQPSIDAEGAVVFYSRLLTSENRQDGGIFRWQDGELEAVVTTIVPFEVNDCDTREVRFVHFNPSVGPYGTGGIYGQNASGQIGFLANFEMGAGLFVTGDDDSCGGEPPDCSMATASVTELWPPRHEMVPIEIVGVTDPAGAEFEQQIVGVSSDEPVSGPGSAHDPDAQIVGGARVLLRSERQGDGNGRVYEIRFSATNDHGSCMGSVQVSVPHDRSGEDATDDGQLYDPTRGD